MNLATLVGAELGDFLTKETRPLFSEDSVGVFPRGPVGPHLVGGVVWGGGPGPGCVSGFYCLFACLLQKGSLVLMPLPYGMV